MLGFLLSERYKGLVFCLKKIVEYNMPLRCFEQDRKKGNNETI